jgi:hypothetical protein
MAQWRQYAATNVTTLKRASEIDAIQTRTDVHVNSKNKLWWHYGRLIILKPALCK